MTQSTSTTMTWGLGRIVRPASPTILIIASVVLFVVFQVTATLSGNAYNASGHPEPFYIAQTSFDAVQVQAWFVAIVEAGKLEAFVRSQWIDFPFFVSVFFFGLVASAMAFRIAPLGGGVRSLPRRLAWLASLLIPFGAVADLIETLISLALTQQPLAVPSGLVVAHSSVATIKFLALLPGLLSLLLALVLNGPIRLVTKSA